MIYLCFFNNVSIKASESNKFDSKQLMDAILQYICQVGCTKQPSCQPLLK